MSFYSGYASRVGSAARYVGASSDSGSWVSPVSRQLRAPRSFSELADHASFMCGQAPTGSCLKKLSHLLYGQEDVFSKTKESIARHFSNNAFTGLFYAIAKTVGLVLSAILNLISYAACFLGSILVSTVIGLGLFILMPLNLYLMVKKDGTKQVMELGQGQGIVYHTLFSYFTAAMVRGCTGSEAKSHMARKGLKARLLAISNAGGYLGTAIANPIFMLVHAVKQVKNRSDYE